MTDLDTIQKKILSFRNERDWQQFHDPKNLAEALSLKQQNKQSCTPAVLSSLYDWRSQ